MKILQILAICLFVFAVEFAVAETLQPAGSSSAEISAADHQPTDMCCSCGCKKEKPKPKPEPEPDDTCGGSGCGKDKDKTAA
ncbi:MAG: hypothetical protein ACYTET_03020 [Planctomycetota bacterium]